MLSIADDDLNIAAVGCLVIFSATLIVNVVGWRRSRSGDPRRGIDGHR